MVDKFSGARDPDDTATRLGRWCDAEVTMLPSAASSGFSHESILFDAAGQPLVARVEPPSEGVFPDPDLAWEYQLLSALRSTDIPLPQLGRYEEDPDVLGAPFYVMERVTGRVPSDSPPYPLGGWLHDAQPDEQASVWWSGLDALIEVQAVPIGTLKFAARDGGPTFDGELGYWERYLAFAGELPAPVLDAWRWLVDEAPSGEVTLCWGDSRIGNQLFDDGGCVAVLDWEMATISDPIQDLAWYCYFDDLFSRGLGVDRLPGIPPPSETARYYAETTRRPIDTFDYHMVFAGVRFAAILHRLGHLLRANGQPAPDPGFVVAHLGTLRP